MQAIVRIVDDRIPNELAELCLHLLRDTIEVAGSTPEAAVQAYWEFLAIMEGYEFWEGWEPDEPDNFARYVKAIGLEARWPEIDRLSRLWDQARIAVNELVAKEMPALKLRGMVVDAGGEDDEVA